MNRLSYIRGRGLLAIGFLLVVPASAQGHGLGAGDPNRPVPDYLWLGFKHLLTGWDHLLFILAIVVLAGSLWRATKLISLFVAGHSITLMLATTNEWRVSTTLVDVVIALSVLFVAVVGLRGRPRDWTLFGAVLFGVGLMHGLGLATRLLDLGVSDANLVWRILLFNIGIEIGQAVAVVAFIGAGVLLARAGTLHPRIRLTGLGAIATAGAVGAVVISLPGTDDTSRAEPIGAACTQTTSDPPPVNLAGHPHKAFYEPNETPPASSFDHVLGDGLVVVRYRPDISTSTLDRLRTLTARRDSAIVAGPDPNQTDAIRARTARRTLTCTRADLAALASFRDRWLDEIRTR